jgi:hypothetical protein
MPPKRSSGFLSGNIKDRHRPAYRASMGRSWTANHVWIWSAILVLRLRLRSAWNADLGSAGWFLPITSNREHAACK